MNALRRFKNGDVIVSIVEWCQDESLRELNRQQLITVDYHGIGFRRLALTPAGQWKLTFEVKSCSASEREANRNER